MGDIISIDNFDPNPDLDSMDRGQLSELLRQVRERISLLNDREPEDMECEEYEDWGDRHEELEDLEEDILDLLGGDGE